MIRDWVDSFNEIPGFFTPDRIVLGIEILLLLGLGAVIIPVTARLVSRVFRRKVSKHSAMLVRKVVYYTGVIILVLAVLDRLGLKLGALLGAAGVIGIAVGFAAQTSLSNLISGLFLIYEHPFRVGDFIKVGTASGDVQTIDLLSVKIRTPGNQFIRIPSSQLLNSELTNVSYYPIRRMDLTVNVTYKEDPKQVMGILREIAGNEPLVLDEPEPLIIFQDMGDSALEFFFAVWFLKTDFVATKNAVMETIKTRFDKEGIKIPFPHRSLYAGSETAPFPIRIVGEKE
ncbi:MAG: mechanosensitive ion channel family protein [Spirochaetaceae bacterium]|nr:mechanosensitive ion channel family protein [Spirochaetaceae bacterium]